MVAATFEAGDRPAANDDTTMTPAAAIPAAATCAASTQAAPAETAPAQTAGTPGRRRTKIVATLGPASRDEA